MSREKTKEKEWSLELGEPQPPQLLLLHSAPTEVLGFNLLLTLG